MKPPTFCSFCGARHPEDAGWPRTCPACQNTAYRSSLPVAVVLVTGSLHAREIASYFATRR